MIAINAKIAKIATIATIATIWLDVHNFQECQ
jgi:hypothetical protein